MESFFYTSCKLDEAEIKEFLLYRYHSLSFMNDMTVQEFSDFYKVAQEKEKEDKLYLQWCAMLPQMSKYMKFSDFYDHMTGRNIDTRSTEVILAEIEEIHRKAKEQEDGS